jgi:hypothetical protein
MSAIRHVVILNCRNPSLPFNKDSGRDLVKSSDHLVIADGEADGLPVHHELPPRLLALADQVIVLLLLLEGEHNSFHFLPA